MSNNHHHHHQNDRNSIEDFFNNPSQAFKHFETYPRSRRNMYEPSPPPQQQQSQQQPQQFPAPGSAAGTNQSFDPNMNHDPQYQQHFNEHEFPFYGPNSLRQRFKDRFFQGHDYYPTSGGIFPDSTTVNDATNPNITPNREPKVYNIPIKIEPRNTSSRDASPKPPSANEFYQQPSATATESVVGHQQHHQQEQPFGSRNVPHQYANPYQQAPTQIPISNNNNINSSSKSVNVPRVIPIQITKSSSTPSAEQQKPQFQQRQQQQEQYQNNPVNESISDPAIADPNKVYAMSYNPTTADPSEKDEIIAEAPEVVALAYEPPVVNKQAYNVVNQENENNSTPNKVENSKVNIINLADKAANNDNNSKVESENPQQQNQETPFDYVKEILDDLSVWEKQVNECNATSPEDKGYKWLDEMLTLCVLRLDCINIDGNDELRKYRKQAIQEVNRVVNLLESKIQKDDSTTTADDDDKKPTESSSNTTTNTKDSSNKKKDSKKKDGKFLSFFKNNKNNSNAAATDTDPNNNDLKTTESIQQQQLKLATGDQSAITTDNDNQNQSSSAKIGRETEV